MADDSLTLRATGPISDDEPLFAAYVGASWHEFYRARFAARAATGRSWSWNWAAALVPFWLSFRRMPLGVAVYANEVFLIVLLTGWLQGPMGQDVALGLAVVIVFGGIGVAQGGLATAAYHERARAAVRRARVRFGADHAAAAAALAHHAPRLTPLSLAIHVIVSVLVFLVLSAAVITFLPHRHDESVAYRALVRSDLRDLVSAQELFFADSLRYATTLAALQFRGTQRVEIEIVFASAEGFRAVARHPRSAEVCEVWVGAVPERRPGSTETVPICRLP